MNQAANEQFPCGNHGGAGRYHAETMILPHGFIFNHAVAPAKQRGNRKGFVLPAYDTKPGYTDTQIFLFSTIKWIDRATYSVGDAPVGKWSNPVSVMVG